jgi:hypothetical protein
MNLERLFSGCSSSVHFSPQFTLGSVSPKPLLASATIPLSRYRHGIPFGMSRQPHVVIILTSKISM